MPRRRYQVLLDAPLDAVWAFHDEIRQGIEALALPGSDTQVTRADPPGEGAIVVIRARGPLRRRIKWTARYVEYQPPTGHAPYRHAGFTDIQDEGPFKSWRHTHRFEETIDEGRVKVWAADEIDYRVGWGPLGMLADRLLVRRELDRMFAHRHRVLRERLTRRG